MSLRVLTLLIGSLVVFDFFTEADYVSSSLSRRKRYLSFPNKAVVSLTVSLLKNIANDIRAGPTTRVVSIHELDVLFPLPYDPSPFLLSQTALGQAPVFHQSHSRSRRDLYAQLEDLFHIQGHEGRSCIMKALCDAKQLPETTEENLLQDLFSVLFSLPRNVTGEIEEDFRADEEDCLLYKERCPFSIFDLAFGWAHQFSSLYNA